MALPIKSATLPFVIVGRLFAALFRLRGTERLFRVLFPPDAMPPLGFEVYLETLRYRGNTANFVDWNILLYGAYEEADLLTLKAFALADDVDVFLDIGANLGQHAMYVSGAVKRVHAFEPNAELHKQFRDNIMRNRIGNVDIHAVALGGTDGTGILYLGADSGGSSLLAAVNDHDERSPVDVAVRNGDSFLREQRVEGNVGMIKIDVEGYEAQVLKGLIDTIHANRPVIVIEISPVGREQFGSVENFAASFPEAYSFYAWRSHGRIRRASELAPAALDTVFSQHGNVYAVPDEKQGRFERSVAQRPARIRHRKLLFVRTL